jgi:radical SAM superfamily enzyme YgiQ (UPF0313 family)
VDVKPARSAVLLLSTIAVVDRNDDSLWTPLSLLALGTVLKEADFQPILVDTQIRRNWKSDIVAALQRADLAFFGVSTLTGPSIAAAVEAIELSRDHRPDLPIVWGGYHASLAKEAILRENLADYVVRGVGEPAVVPLARVLAETRLGDRPDVTVLSVIPNLSFLHDGGTVDTRTVAQNWSVPAFMDAGLGCQLTELPIS